MKASTLERRHRKRRRDAGEKLHIFRTNLSPDVDRLCEMRGISRSEYVLELIREDRGRVEYIKRELTLPAHIWQFIEQEAASNYGGDIPGLVREMYDQARIYRAMNEPSPRKRRGV